MAEQVLSGAPDLPAAVGGHRWTGGRAVGDGQPAVPFALVMVLLCVALVRDLRHDPLMRRQDRSRRAVEQAVDYGLGTYGEQFVLGVKPTGSNRGQGSQQMGTGATSGNTVDVVTIELSAALK
jgi:hypothetical protein